MEASINLKPFELFAESNNWGAIWPEISLGLLALLLLVMDLFLPQTRQRVLPMVAIMGQVFILCAFLLCMGSANEVQQTSLFAGMIEQSMMGQSMRVFFMLSSILVCYLASVYFSRQQLPKMEFFHITIVVAASMMLLVQSSHFVMLFVALETVTIGFYVLVSYCRTSPFSLESGLKYLILGGASSSILLFGIVLLYGAAGNPALDFSTTDSMSFSQLGLFIEHNADSKLVQAGVVLVLCGLFFKIGAVPFQIWIPDVYQGAPTPAAAFLAVASKAAGFVVLVNLLQGPFLSLSHLTSPLLSAVAVVTILFGNLTALTQRNVKRLMGLSGISHAGYLLLGAVALVNGVTWAPYAIVFYLFTYLFGSFAVFGVMAQLATSNDETQELDDYQDLAQREPFLAGVLTIGLGSLAGIPPLAGFIGKLFLFISAYKAGLLGLLAVSVVGVVVSIYYYFGWVREVYFKVLNFPPDEQETKSSTSIVLPLVHRVTLGSLAVVTVLLGIYQGVLGAKLF